MIPKVFGFPGVEDFVKGALQAMFGWFLDQWSTAGGNAIASAMERMQASATIPFTEPWMKIVWDNYFGLFLLAAVIVLGCRAITFGLSRRDLSQGYSLISSIEDVIRLLVTGFLMFVGISYIQFAIGIICGIILRITTANADPGVDWTQAFSSRIELLDIWGGGLLSFLIMLNGAALWVQSLVMHQLAFVFAIGFMMASGMRGTGFGNFMYRLTKAGLLTCLTLVVFQFAWLGIWSTLAASASDESVMVAAAVRWFATIIPALVGPILIFASFWIRGKTEVSGEVKVTNQVDTKRANDAAVRLQPNGDGGYAGTITVPTMYTGPRGDDTGDRDDGPDMAALVASGLTAIAIEKGGEAIGKKAMVTSPVAGAAIIGGSKVVGNAARSRSTRGSRGGRR